MKNGSTTESGNNALRVIRYGKIVFIMGRLTTSATTKTTILAQIPEGFRPPFHLRKSIPRYDNYYGNIAFGDDGAITLINDNGLSESKKTYYFSESWTLL